MVEGTEVAWRLLEIIALALPAIAILIQFLNSAEDESRRILNRYLSVTAALLLIAPLSIAATVSIGVIITSYQVDWLPWATIPMAFSFVLIPIVLFWRWRAKRELFEDVFLEREREAVLRDIERDEISEEQAEDILREVKTHQKGLIWNLRNPQESKLIPRMTRYLSYISIFFGVLILYQGQRILVSGFAIFVICYALITLSDRNWTETALSYLEEGGEEQDN